MDNKSFDANISFSGGDDIGIVSKITDIISRDLEVNMKSINIKANNDGTFGGTIEVLVQNKDHLTELVNTIKKAHKYIEVERIESLNLN